MANFRSSILNPFKFNLFTLSKLPLAFIAGLKVLELTEQNAQVSIKYNYWTKNPFQSMYFAAQAMAAELSTGVLVMQQVELQKPEKISMLVLNMSAEFSKKAIGRIIFECTDGQELQETIKQVISTNEGRTIELTSVGKDETGDVVSTFRFVWTLKKKS